METKKNIESLGFICFILFPSLQIFSQTLNVGVSYTNLGCCSSLCDGTATANVTGGVTPYTYMWSDPNGQTTQTATGLCPGLYAVVVYDAALNSATSPNVVITYPSITSSFASTQPSCYGNNDGSTTANAGGGTSPYTYSWSNGQTSQTTTGLAAATYTLTITDAKCCTATKTVTVTQPYQLVSSPVLTNSVTCNGGNNGSLQASASGGTLPYTYLWNTGQTTTSLSGLIAGTYSLTVTDSHGCTASAASINIPQPTAITNAFTTVNPNCGNNNGMVISTSGGGTSPYSFSWNTGSTINLVVGLTGSPPDTLIVTITDANGCILKDTTIITCTSLGVENVNLQSQFNIYPNASNGIFNIENTLLNNSIYGIYIYNITGEKVYQSTIQQFSNTTIDLSNHPNGIYFLTIKTNEGTTNKKLIINK
ncbi:MAG: T9SS type A sorting domain-containing protein [Bacteroidetes bacterium]|nr:T9SS type A sorting domain-containing protein [Bacteroidota bacterium]